MLDRDAEGPILLHLRERLHKFSDLPPLAEWLLTAVMGRPDAECLQGDLLLVTTPSDLWYFSDSEYGYRWLAFWYLF